MAIPPPSDKEFEIFQRLGSIEDLASFLGTTQDRLFYHLYSKSRPRYKSFTLSKASGGQRTIASPPKIICAFQRKLLQCLTPMVRLKDPVHGFVRFRSVVTNARPHINKKLILNIDIKDFFNSIHFGRVRGVFLKPPFSFPLNVATVLAEICCLNGFLPQGAPTSPILTNFICRRLDRNLERLARKHHCRYTRYADDITFSTNQKEFEAPIMATPPTLEMSTPTLGFELAQIFQHQDFQINEKKLHFRTMHQRQEVTGLIVNKKVNVPRKFIRNLRAMIHDCEKNYMVANSRFRDLFDRKERRASSPSLAEHIRGKLDYLRMVRGDDDLLYSKLALRAQRALRFFKYGIPIWGKASDNVQLLEAIIWVVIGRDHEGHILKTGTAFSLEGIGLVSCGHLFKNHNGDDLKVHKWEVIRASEPGKTFQISEIRHHSHIDLSILYGNQSQMASLKRAECKVKTGDPLTVIGFPEWHTIADKIFRDPGLASQIKIISGLEYIITNRNIRDGNSGGPILDKNGLVIGVVVYGSMGLIAPNSGIDIRHIDEVLSEPKKRL
jgi:RNA-directed DNA polymerase